MLKHRDRSDVPAHQAFAARQTELQDLDLSARFRRIYETNLWGSEVSRSGSGSVDEQTARIREALPVMLRELGVKSMLDIPCGDFAWMQYVDLSGVRYLGGDIVPDLVHANQQRFGTTSADAASASREFRVLDLTSDALPTVDLVFIRDCLVHLSVANIRKATENLKRSGSVWLLTTTFPEHGDNEDVEDGDWRLLNFERAPFHFPAPVTLLNEGCTEQNGNYADKSLGLWRIADLP